MVKMIIILEVFLLYVIKRGKRKRFKYLESNKISFYEIVTFMETLILKTRKN